jgi:hypothetical protein
MEIMLKGGESHPLCCRSRFGLRVNKDVRCDTSHITAILQRATVDVAGVVPRHHAPQVSMNLPPSKIQERIPATFVKLDFPVVENRLVFSVHRSVSSSIRDTD